MRSRPLRNKKKGRRPSGYSLNIHGSKVFDSEVIDVLKQYRSDPLFKAEGGSKVLSKYLRRDHKIIINHKKTYKLCRQNQLLLSKGAKKKLVFTTIIVFMGNWGCPPGDLRRKRNYTAKKSMLKLYKNCPE